MNTLRSEERGRAQTHCCHGRLYMLTSRYKGNKGNIKQETHTGLEKEPGADRHTKQGKGTAAG